MNYAEMTIEELETRKSQIATELDADGADLDKLEEEVRSINTELENRKKAEAQKVELRKAVAAGNGKELKNKAKEDSKMENTQKTLDEIRASKEYVDAYVKYIKTEDDSECRALLSANSGVAGSVPVPSYVEGRVKTAWARLGVMDLVRKTYVRGNLTVGFELSATAATTHTEGTTPIAEETLTLGAVALIPQSIKKFIRISDEALDLSGEEFLDYIYDELTYQIAKYAQGVLIGKITALTASATSTAVGVGVIAGTPTVGVVAEAIGQLSDEASNPVIVMNKATWAQFKAAQYDGKFNVDPFEGLPVHFDSSLPAYTATGTTGSTWAIVGDFGQGAQANFPKGDEITIKVDDGDDAEADLVKFIGREYVGLGIVADHAFCKITF